MYWAHPKKDRKSRSRTASASRGKKLCDGKPLAGKGRLSDTALNLLQNYFGMAIRQNLGNIYQMKKAVWATLILKT